MILRIGFLILDFDWESTNCLLYMPLGLLPTLKEFLAFMQTCEKGVPHDFFTLFAISLAYFISAGQAPDIIANLFSVAQWTQHVVGCMSGVQTPAASSSCCTRPLSSLTSFLYFLRSCFRVSVVSSSLRLVAASSRCRDSIVAS